MNRFLNNNHFVGDDDSDFNPNQSWEDFENHSKNISRRFEHKNSYGLPNEELNILRKQFIDYYTTRIKGNINNYEYNKPKWDNLYMSLANYIKSIPKHSTVTLEYIHSTVKDNLISNIMSKISLLIIFKLRLLIISFT
jgi:hypothetical protein